MNREWPERSTIAALDLAFELDPNASTKIAVHNFARTYFGLNKIKYVFVIFDCASSKLEELSLGTLQTTIRATFSFFCVLAPSLLPDPIYESKVTL